MRLYVLYGCQHANLTTYICTHRIAIVLQNKSQVWPNITTYDQETLNKDGTGTAKFEK